MLEGIFKGLLQWLYDMALEIIEYIANGMLDVFSMDLSYFESVIPVTGGIVDIIIAIGWALLLGNLVFQAAKSIMSGLGFEGEDPKTLFARTFVFAFFLLASRQICEIGLGISNTAIELLQVPPSITITLPDDNAFSIAASWLLVIIIGFVLMWQIVKLFFEIGERYFLVGLLTILSPLAFATGGSKNTADIFKGWARMYGSMCLMMILNVVFLKMLISAMGYMPSGPEVIPWLIFVVAIARVARKIDDVISRIGLNPAITGNGLGSRLPGMLSYMVMRTATSAITKAVGSAASKSKTPPNGTPPNSSRTSSAGNRTGGFYQRSTNSSSSRSTASDNNTASTASSSSAAQHTRSQTDARYGAAGRAATSPVDAPPPSGSWETPHSPPHPSATGGPGTAGTSQSSSVHQQSKASQRNSDARRSSVTQAGAQRGQAFRPSGAAGNTTVPHAPTPNRPHPSDAAGKNATPNTHTTERTGAATIHPPIPRSQQAPPAANTGAAGKTSQGESSVHRPARFSAVPPNKQSPDMPGRAGAHSGVISDSRIQQGGTNINAQHRTNVQTGQSSVRQESHNADNRGAAATRGADNAATRSATPRSNAATPGTVGTETRRSAAAPDKASPARQSAVAPSPNAESRVQSTTPGTGRDRPATAAGAQVQGGSRQARQESGSTKADNSRMTQRTAPGVAGRAAESRESGPVKKPELSKNRPNITSPGITTRSPIDNTPKRAKGAKQTRKNRKGGKT